MGLLEVFFVYNVPGIVLGAGNRAVNKAEETLPSRSMYFNWGKEINKSKICTMSDGDKS